MSGEKYNLTWHTYSDHLREMLSDLRNDESSKDVTLVCDNRMKIKAHQIVLKACSPVFSKIFDNFNNQQNSVICLQGIQHQELESILKFMYLGEASFYEDRIEEFLNVAKSLEVKELSNNIEHNKLPDLSENVKDDCSDPEETLQDESSINSLEDHFKIKAKDNKVTAREQKPLTANCPDCEKHFSQRIAMLIHHKSIHQGVQFPCGQCDYKAKFQSVLKTHIQSNHENIEYSCFECDFKTTTQVKLTYHIQSKHEVKKYCCSHCDYKASHPHNLKSHVQSKHQGVKYPCNECDYKGTHPGNLSKHIKSMHEGVKYPCSQCEFKASNQSNLIKHVQSQHEGKVYLCDQCDHKSSYQTHLKAHVQSKHGANVYLCEQCDYKTSYHRYLRKHLQTKHKTVFENTVNKHE